MPDGKQDNRKLLTIGLGVLALTAIVALVFALQGASDRSGQIDQLSNDLASTQAANDELAAQAAQAQSDADAMESQWLAQVALGRQFPPNDTRLLAVEAATRSPGPGSLSALGTVLFTDPRLQRPIAELEHDGPVWVTAVAGDGSAVATGSHDATVKLWSNEGALIATLINPGDVLAARFSPNSKFIASGSREGTATVWTVAGDEVVTAIHGDRVNDVAISSDGLWLVSGGHDGIALVTDIASGETEHELSHPDIIWSVAVAPDDQRIATGSKDGWVRVWDLTSGDLVRDYEVGTPVETLSYSPDGSWLLAGGQQGKALAVATADGVATVIANDGFRGGIVDVDWHPDASELALVSLGGIHRYDLPGLQLVAEHLVAGGTRGVAYGPDGTWLASASGDFQFSFGQIVFWDAATGKQLVGLDLGGPVETINVSPEGSVVAGFRMTEDLVEVGGAWLVPGPERWIGLACEGTDATISAQTWNELTDIDESHPTNCP